MCGESGRPGYFCGKEETEVPRVEAICAASSGSILSGTKVVLEKLLERPVAAEKSSRIFFEILGGRGVYFYNDQGVVGVLEDWAGRWGEIGCGIRFWLVASMIIRWRT